MVNLAQNPRKKILYVITKSNWGGAQRYMYDLATNLPKDRFEIAVACGGNGLLAERLQEREIKTIGVPAFQRDVNFFKEFAAFFQLLKIFRQEEPDVIHLNSSKAGVLGSLAAFFYKLITYNLKLKTVFTVHGWPFNEDRGPLSKLFIFLASWFPTLFQDKIIVINKADLASAKKFISSDKISLIYNGISPIDFVPRDKARAFLTEKTGVEISTDILLVGIIAELTKNKGLEYLIGAADNLKTRDSKIKFIMIGAGENQSKLEHRITTLGLQNSVFLAGFIRDANQYLKAFDIFILPSVKEGLPYTIIEAMSAGLPIVATSVGGMPDLITDWGNGLLVPPKNPEALAQKIEVLLANRSLREQIGQKARQNIEEKFGLKKMLDETVNLYENV